MPGMVELAEEVFHMPVRVGVPKYFGGLAEAVKDPRFSTSIGLLLIGKDQLQKPQVQNPKPPRWVACSRG